jgi:ribonucleoside-triphosphate reductase
MVMKLNEQQYYTFLSRYARWNGERRETYGEACFRAIDYLARAVREATGYQLTTEEQDDLLFAMQEMEAFPSLRLFQMAGPAAERCNLCIYNCAYRAVDSLSAFSEALYVSMQGTGLGFSVEQQYVDQLPYIIRRLPKGWQHTIPVGDSTEGWCNAFQHGLTALWDGVSPIYDDSRVRSAGSRLHTKGGRASGPEPLRDLFQFAERIVSKYWEGGGRLTPLEAHDLMCMIGQTVVVGGVRRTAMISLSDLTDPELRHAKDGHFWHHSPWRSMANNSAVYNERPTWEEFVAEWSALQHSGTGERGIFNRGSYRHLKPDRRLVSDWGVNPCGEVYLRNQGLCNLSVAVAREHDTWRTLHRKVVIAAIFGTLQSALTKFGWLPQGWTDNANEERLLGVDITGQMDCPDLRPGAPHRERLLECLKARATRTNREWAAKLGINPSVAVTCVKPSGNSAQLFDCSSGLHPRYAPHYIRRFRASWDDPLTHLMQDSGVPWHPEVGQQKHNCNTVVFEFPVAAPAGAVTRRDLSALEQFRNWLTWKKHYTEHNPSVTIQVKPEEWDDLGNEVWAQFDNIGGLSFLPLDDHLYELAPYEEITAEKFQELKAKIPSIPWEKLPEYEQHDNTTSSQELACTGDKCEL